MLSIALERALRWRPSIQVWRAVVVCAVIFASAYLGRLNSQSQALQISMAVIAIAGVIVVLRWPALGLIGVLVAAMSAPFDISTGTQTAIPVSMLLVGALTAIWIAAMLLHRHAPWISSAANLPIVCLIIAATLSLIAGSLPWNYFARTAPLTAQLGGWALFVFSGLVFLLAANQLGASSWLKVAVAVVIAAGLIACLDRIVPGLSPLTSLFVFRRAIDRNTEIGLAHQSLFWVWPAVLAAGQGLGNRELGLPGRVLLLAAAIAIVGQLWLGSRDWASGWLPIVVGMEVIIVVRFGWKGVLLSVVAGLVVLMSKPDLVQTLISGDTYSIDTRAAAKDILLRDVIPLSPVFGLGPANYYFYTPLFSILGWQVSFNSHNQYIDMVAQTGIVGMVTFAWFFAVAGWILWRMHLRCGQGFVNGYVLACMGGLVGTLAAGALADWIIPFTYNIGMFGFRASLLPWLFLGGAIAIDYRLRTQESEKIE